VKTPLIARELKTALRYLEQMNDRPFTPESPRQSDPHLRGAADQVIQLAEQLAAVVAVEFPHNAE
jgi:hypothetical protein